MSAPQQTFVFVTNDTDGELKLFLEHTAQKPEEVNATPVRLITPKASIMARDLRQTVSAAHRERFDRLYAEGVHALKCSLSEAPLPPWD